MQSTNDARATRRWSHRLDRTPEHRSLCTAGGRGVRTLIRPILFGVVALLLAGTGLLFVPGATTAWAQDPPSVFLDVSDEARNRLRTVDAYVKDENWNDAIEVLQSLIESFGDKIVPAPAEGENVDSPPDHYLNVRTACQIRIAQLPAPGLTAYRDRVDGQAKELLKEAEETGEQKPLLRIADDFLCSSEGATAIDLLGETALREGHYDEAISWWSMIVPQSWLMATQPELGGVPQSRRRFYPELPAVSSEVQARRASKWIVAQILAGNFRVAQAGIAALSPELREQRGKIAGREGAYASILQKVLDEHQQYRKEHPAGNSDWRSFAGNQRRNKQVHEHIGFGDVQWKWTYADPAAADRAGHILEDDLLPQQAQKEADSLAYHPVVVNGTAFVMTNKTLWAFDLETGKQEHVFDFSADQNFPGRDTYKTSYTLTVSGNYLLVRSGGPVSHDTNGFMQNSSLPIDSRIYCFDHRLIGEPGNEMRRRLWSVNSRSLEERRIYFEGTPVATDRYAIVATSRRDAMAETAVMAFDLQTGEERWRALIGEASLGENSGESPQLLLTLADNQVFCCTNQGAIACIDARSGQVQWVTTYAKGREKISGNDDAPPAEINPCVYDQGRLFVAPSDSDRILCLDAATGTVLWRQPIRVTDLLGVDEGKLIASGERIWALDTLSGREAWHWPENTATPYGRGLLSGGNVYWPTRQEIHVIDLKTGRKAQSSVPLYERFGIRAGNLVFGNGYLLIAQPSRLVAISPYAKVIERLQLELTQRPNATDLHLRLADTAMESQQYPLAGQHYRLAAFYAHPEEFAGGSNLVQHARQRTFDALLAHANHLRTEGRQDDARRTFEEARRAAPSPLRQIDVTKSVAAMWEEANEPARAVSLFQQILSDPKMRMQLVEVDAKADGNPDRPHPVEEVTFGVAHGPVQATRIPASQWAEQQIDRLVTKHGREIYREWAEAARVASEGTRDPSVMVEIASRYPNAPTANQLWGLAGERFLSEGRTRDALRAFRRLDRRSEPGSPERLQALLGQWRVSEQLGGIEQQTVLLQSLDKEFAKSPLPSTVASPKVDGATPKTVGEFARTRLEALQFPAAPATWNNLTPLAAQWQRTTSEPANWMVPAGIPPQPRQETLLMASSADEAAKEWRLEGIKPATGGVSWQTAFQSASVQPTLWSAYGSSGLLTAEGTAVGDRLCLRDWESGAVVWAVPLQAPARSGTVLNQDTIPAAFRVSQGTQTPLLKPEYLLETSGDLLFLYDKQNHVLRALVEESGETLWEVDIPDSTDVATLVLADSDKGDTVLLQSARSVWGIDGATGQPLFRHSTRLETVSPLLVAGDQVVFASELDTIESLGLRDGKVRWTRKTPWANFGPPRLISDGDAIYCQIDDQQLLRLALADGKVDWWKIVAPIGGKQRRLEISFWDDKLVVGTKGQLQCRSKSDGKLLWNWTREHATGAAAASANSPLHFVKIGGGIACVSWGESNVPPSGFDLPKPEPEVCWIEVATGQAGPSTSLSRGAGDGGPALFVTGMRQNLEREPLTVAAIGETLVVSCGRDAWGVAPPRR